MVFRGIIPLPKLSLRKQAPCWAAWEPGWFPAGRPPPDSIWVVVQSSICLSGKISKSLVNQEDYFSSYVYEVVHIDRQKRIEHIGDRTWVSTFNLGNETHELPPTKWTTWWTELRRVEPTLTFIFTHESYSRLLLRGCSYVYTFVHGMKTKPRHHKHLPVLIGISP